MNGSGKKKLILPLAGLLGTMTAGIILFFLGSRVLESPPALTDVNIDSEAIIKLGMMEQVSKKHGITEWELKAATATLLKHRDKAVLTDATIIFHTENQSTITLTADKGDINTKTHDMTFSENVVVRHETYTLRTDKLHYEKKPHIIHSDTRVRLEDADSVIEADAMVVELNENQITFNGNVEGTFSENFKTR